METGLVPPEAIPNTPDEQPKLDQEASEFNAENSYYYSREYPSDPMALLLTATVGPQLPKAAIVDP